MWAKIYREFYCTGNVFLGKIQNPCSVFDKLNVCMYIAGLWLSYFILYECFVWKLVSATETKN